jgi:hypothetical protein
MDKIIREDDPDFDAKLANFIRPYDDNIFLDLSFNTEEYRVISKGNGNFLLYIAYSNLGLFGSFGDYKALFSFKRVDNSIEIIVCKRIKSFTILVLCFCSAIGIFGIVDNIIHHDILGMFKIIFAVLFVFGLLFFERKVFKKKVKYFFLNLV